MMSSTNALNVDFATGVLSGPLIIQSTRTLADLAGIFADQAAFEALDSSRVVYRVQSFQPVCGDTKGSLFGGATFLESGLVGDEYFMTVGHFQPRCGHSPRL